MADWKQITARIRRARTSKDPAAQLAMLFSKTHDAMVAFELARYYETAGNSTDAGRWYFTAAERFRRSDWKTKAQESATRLGATGPAEIPELPSRAEASVPAIVTESEPSEAAALSVEPVAAGEALEEPLQIAAAAGVHTGRPQRSGRRGGRNLPRGAKRGERSSSHAPARESHGRVAPAAPPAASDEPIIRPLSSRGLDDASEAPAPSLRGRSGDPGLSSRLSQLEMNFRRLLGSAPTKLEDATRAPAGPGVWVLTDSDLATYYYVEACQTLRVAIPNLLRSGATRRGESIKPQLAEHLGIPETRVAKYLADHCVVRWLQMDEGASHFAHFLVAVLHPALNE
jgi:hypothetical protein